MAVSGYRVVVLFEPVTSTLAGRIPNIAVLVYGCAFSIDGERRAVAAGTPGGYGEVRLFQIATGDLVATLGSSTDSMLDVAFSPDGTQIAACGADRVIRIWNAADGQEVQR